MRRQEFSVTDEREFISLCNEAPTGCLGIVTADGYPRVVPLNFALYNGAIYFHGASAGEKFFSFSSEPKVTFSIYREYSLIPSYWIARDYACPATALFKSALIKGNGTIVSSPELKASVLQAIMEKYQPEGNHKPITATDTLYKKMLAEVAIYKIIPTTVDMKFKFGQQWPEERKRLVIQKLEERGSSIDLLTALEIKKHLEI
ncbi:MAG: pyridoxamine 5'-phosphate oxidase family protein [Ignavibacteria bacterium]|nr:pyridoxamine 5'-phosphate oxidase family protein [Ignavibacteria bacterium]